VTAPETTRPASRVSLILNRVLRRLAFYPFLVAALLVFPAWLPWMILGWLLLYAARRFQGRPGWPPLAMGVAMVLFKRVDWAPGLVVLGLVMIAAAVLDRVRERNAALRIAALVAAGALVPAWLGMAWDWTRVGHTSRRPVLAADRPIVCMGDSLSVTGYPRILEKRLRVPVVDKAQGGITTADGVKQLPEVLALKPQAIVIELGGHDSLRGRSRSEAKENLETLIRAGRDAGAEVFLFEIPRAFVMDPYAGLERELARKYDLELIHDGAVRQLVIFSPFTPLGKSGRVLSYDGLHPNDAGNAFLADRVEAALKRVYGVALQR
jgi:lysophospholipase L1-like esterase